MVTTEKDIKVTRGDTFGFNFDIKDGEGLEPTLDAVYFSVKETPEDDDYTFQKTLTNGITRLTGGGYYVRIDPSDTQDLDKDKYYYDLQVNIDDDVYTPLKGKLDIRWDITREA